MKVLAKPIDVFRGCAMGAVGVHHGHNCVDRGQGAAECFSCQLIFEVAFTSKDKTLACRKQVSFGPCTCRHVPFGIRNPQ